MSFERVALVGATGAVGKEMINCLFSEKYPIESLFLFASTKSVGAVMETPFGELAVAEFSVDAVLAAGARIVLLAVSGGFSEEFSPILAQKGCIVIDNSSAFRYMGNVPLVIPELNSETLPDITSGKGCIIANPNCTTAILAMALFPIHQNFGVKKVISSTYQAASGAGEPGVKELEAAMAARANGDFTFKPSVFSHNLCCNVIPCIDVVQANNYTKEEMKMVWETQKIFKNSNIQISCTAVRVPTIRAHCVSAVIETENEVSPDAVRSLLAVAPGVIVADDPVNKVYPVPADATGKYEILVGRIRQSLIFGSHGIEMFVSGDQLLRGAALNAVRIACHLVVSR